MKFKTLRILAMPGFPDGGPTLENLSEGMNVLIGVNGSGKTTLARAIRWLLWPGSADRNAPRRLIARTMNNRVLEVDESYSKGHDRVDLPPENHADCFTITADELFHGGTAGFAELVKLKLSGQVSVDGLYRTGESLRSHTEVLKNLRERYEKRRQELNEEHVRAARLHELKAKLEEATRAEKRLRRLERALERREVERDIRSMIDLKNAKPADLDNALMLEEEIRKLREEVSEKSTLAEASRRKIGETRLAGSPARVLDISGALDALLKSAEKTSDLREEEARMLSVLSGIPPDADWKMLDSILAAGVNHENTRARISTLRNSIQEIDRQLGSYDENTLKAGRSLLARWLALKEQRSPLLPGAMVVFGVYFAAGGDMLPAVILIAMAAGVFALPSIRAERVRKGYSALALDSPASWTVHDVLVLQESLAMLRNRLHRRGELRRELEGLEEKIGPSGEALEELMESMGVSSSLGMEGIVFRMKRLPELDDLRGRIKNSEEVRDRCFSSLRDLFVSMGEPAPESIEAAAPRVEDLLSRERTFREESLNLEGFTREIRSGEEKLEDMEEKLSRIFRRNRLEPGNMAALEELHSRYQDYRDACIRLKHLEDPEGPICDDCIDLEEEIRAASSLASSRPDLADEIALARAAEARLEKSSELAEMLSAIRRQEEKIKAVEEGNRRVGIRNRLLDMVKKEYQVEIQPSVVNRASTLLSRFTSGRYSLSPVSLEDPEMKATDSETGDDIPLDSLSRGTRMQLLLALKIAFAELVEGGEKLPIVFDEVLANTDHGRFREVALSMAELAAQGRQLFYLTCQEPDAALIQEVFRSSGPDPVKPVRIDHREPGHWPVFQGLAGKIPPPEDKPYDLYVSGIPVPPPSPRTRPKQLHPAWALNDSRLLHSLLEANLDTLGKALTAGRRVLDDRDYLAMERGAEVTEAVLSAFSRGRPVPLNRRVLEGSPVRRSGKFEQIFSLSEELDHNPERLLEALREKRVSRLQTQLIDQLEEYLIAGGHLPGESPHSRESGWMWVLQASGLPPRTTRKIFDRLWDALETGPPAE